MFINIYIYIYKLKLSTIRKFNPSIKKIKKRKEKQVTQKQKKSCLKR